MPDPACAGSESIPLQLTLLQGTGQGNLDLTWSQVAGPDVEFADMGDGAARFQAPSFNAELVFELSGSSAGTIVASDRRKVTVRTVGRDQGFDLMSRYPVGGPDAVLSAMAHEPVSQRVFILDESGPTIHAVDLATPSSPQLVEELPQPSSQPNFTPGVPRALAAGSGYSTIAVAYGNDPPELPGRLVFFDGATFTELKSIEIGPRPVDLEGSAGVGSFVVTCAADPLPSSANPGEIIVGR